MSSLDTDLIKERRALIDLIAEARSRSIRVALFGTQLHRPDPEERDTEQERASQLRVLLDTIRWIERTHLLLKDGHDPWDKLSPELCDWLATFVVGDKLIVSRMEAMSEASRRVGRAAEADHDDLGAALAAHYEARRSGFMDAVTTFCDAIWASMDADRNAEVALAREVGHAIQSALKRLESIGKHVRLVALNASIEANRIGDMGRGVGIIASEFKALAEEIQELSMSAGDELTKLSNEPSPKTGRTAERNAA